MNLISKLDIDAASIELQNLEKNNCEFVLREKTNF